jgi:hypothetical protein
LNLAGFSDIKYKYNKGYLIKCRKLEDWYIRVLADWFHCLI